MPTTSSLPAVIGIATAASTNSAARSSRQATVGARTGRAALDRELEVTAITTPITLRVHVAPLARGAEPEDRAPPE